MREINIRYAHLLDSHYCLPGNLRNTLPVVFQNDRDLLLEVVEDYVIWVPGIWNAVYRLLF